MPPPPAPAMILRATIHVTQSESEVVPIFHLVRCDEFP
jgi:hypothetical protein